MTTVYPASQAFARAPDGGTLIGSPAVNFSVAGQAILPVGNTAILTSEPTPPEEPTRPNLQALGGQIPVNYELLPDFLDVDLSLVVPDTQDANTYVVTDAGNFPTVPQESLRASTIASCVDYLTGAAPNANSVNLLITLAPGSSLLTSYGVSLLGRTIFFTTGAWIPAGTVPRRKILVYGELVLVIANKDDAGVPFDWSGAGGPGAGTVFNLDVQASSGEVLSLLFPTLLNIVPDTFPVPTTPGDVETHLPVPTYEVSDQELTIGTPVDYSQGIHF